MNYTKREWKVALARYKNKLPAIHIYREECPEPIVGHGSGIVICTINTESVEAEANAHLIAAAPLGYELAKFTSLVSATWIEEGTLEIGEGDYLRMKQLALEFLAKAEGK